MARGSAHAAGRLRRRPWLRFLSGFVVLLAPAAAAAAGCLPCCRAVLSPSSLALVAGQTSPPLTLRVTCPGAGRLSFHVAVTPDLPARPRAEPAPVVVTFPPGATKASATFRLATTTATQPGLYTVALVEDERELSATLALTVEEPRGSLAVQPPRVSAVPGETTAALLLRLSDTNLSGAVLRFDLVAPAALGGSVATRPAPVLLSVPFGGGASAPFQLQVGLGAPPGTYPLALREAGSGLRAEFSLTVEAPRVAAAVTPGEVAVAPAQVSPPLTLAVETNLSGVTLDFAPRLPARLAGRISLVPPVVRVAIPPGSHRGEARFQVAASGDAPPGAFTVTLAEPRFGGEAAFTLNVESSRARLSVVPRRVSVPPGQTGPSQALHVESTNLAGVPLTFEAEWPAPLRDRAALEPARLAVTVPAGGGSARAVFRVRCGPEAPPGTYAINLSDREHGLRVAFELEIPPLRGRVELVPRSVSLLPGQASPPLTLRVGDGDLSGIALAFEARMPAELSGRCRTTPATVRLTVAAGASEAAATFQVVCAPDAPAGPFLVEMVEPTFGLRADFGLEIGPLPEIGSVVPGSVAAGTVAMILRLEGRGFEPGAAVSSPSPLLTFGSTRVLTAELAETTVSVRSDAPPGPYRLDLANPDGGRTRDGATLLVHPAGTLGAPLGVRTSAIVFPLSGALMAVDETMHALGLLATTGTGTILGVWLLDGVPFDRFVVHAAGGLPVSLRSAMPIPRTTLGPHRLQLAIEVPQRMVSEAVSVTLVPDRSDRFRLLAPADGASLPPGPVRFRWTPVPGVEGYEIEVYREDDEGLSLRRRVPLPLWTPGERDAEEMAPGPWLWRVRPLFTGGVPGPFSDPRRCLFLPPEARLSRLAVRYLPPWRPGGGGSGVALGFAGLSMEWALSAQEPEPPPPAEEPSGNRPTWLLSANAIFNQPGGDNLPDPPLNGTLALSGQVDRAGGSSILGGTGSHTYNRTWPGGAPPQENRNWVLHGGKDLSAVVRNAGGQSGFVAPSLAFGSELMTIGLNKGGTEATLALPGNLALAYFETFDPALMGMASGVLGSEETLQAGSLATTVAGIKLRAVGLEVDKAASEFTPGGRGSLFGILASYEGSRLQVFFEGAQSDVSPDAESFEAQRKGEAWRLRLAGTWAGWSGSASLGRTGAGFGNPASQGLTAAAGADQSNADLSLGRSFGAMALALSFQHAEGGDTDARLDGGGVNVTAPLSKRVTLTLGGTLSTTRSDGVEEWGLPASRVDCRGGTLSLAESLGSASLGQSLTYQETEDRHDPSRWSAVTDAVLTATAMPLPQLSVSAQVHGTRTRLAPAFGTTESLLVTVEPAWTLPSRNLAVRPFASFARNECDLQPGATETEAYRLILSWSPGWLRSLLSLEAGSDWSRTRSAGLPDEGFIRSHTLTLALRRDRS